MKISNRISERTAAEAVFLFALADRINSELEPGLYILKVVDRLLSTVRPLRAVMGAREQ
jgi:hypothetical protein